MKKRKGLTTFIWVMVCIGFLAVAPMVWKDLPHPEERLLTPAEPEWSGLLNCWVIEGFPGANGQLPTWLNKRIAEFEKKHKGTLVQVRTMTADGYEKALDAHQWPDMVIVPLSMGAKVEPLLLPIAYPQQVYPALRACGEKGEVAYLAPVAMGAYGLMGNRAKAQAAGVADALSIWDKLEAMHGQATRKNSPWYALQCPMQTPVTNPPAALAALLDRQQLAALPQGALPEDLCAAKGVTAWSDFVMDGKYGMYMCTQREVGRIKLLQAGGREFDWTLEAVSPYTDLVYLFGAVAAQETGTENDAARQALLGELYTHLVSVQSQEKLTQTGYFSVLEALPPLYGDSVGMQAMEEALYTQPLIVPNAFTYEKTYGN